MAQPRRRVPQKRPRPGRSLDEEDWRRIDFKAMQLGPAQRVPDGAVCYGDVALAPSEAEAIVLVRCSLADLGFDLGALRLSTAAGRQSLQASGSSAPAVDSGGVVFKWPSQGGLGAAVVAARDACATGSDDNDKRERISSALAKSAMADPSIASALEGIGLKDGKFESKTRLDEILKRLDGIAPVGDGGEEEDGGDARTLAIERSRGGGRVRDFKNTADVLQESSWLDWPVDGPRTALWCIRFIATHYGTPLVRHGRFMTEGKLQYHDPGCSQHQVGCQILQHALAYDQLEIGQLACMEVLCRSLQLIELKHKDKFIPSLGAGDPNEDFHLYMGLSQTRGVLMVSPALERHVGEELKVEFKASESRRKAHEERQLRKTKK